MSASWCTCHHVHLSVYRRERILQRRDYAGAIDSGLHICCNADKRCGLSRSKMALRLLGIMIIVMQYMEYHLGVHGTRILLEISCVISSPCCIVPKHFSTTHEMHHWGIVSGDKACIIWKRIWPKLRT